MGKVLALLDCSRSTLYNLMRDHGFPRPRKIPGLGNRWMEDEVYKWLFRASELPPDEPPAKKKTPGR